MKYIHKQYLNNFLIFGLMNGFIQTIINLEKSSIGSFLIHFILSGAFMSFFIVRMHTNSLAKLGITDVDEAALTAHQKRELVTTQTSDEFSEFIVNSDIYDIKSKKGNSYRLKKMYYTTEFERNIALTYVEGEPAKIIVQNIPSKFVLADIGKAHQNVNQIYDYLLRSLADTETA